MPNLSKTQIEEKPWRETFESKFVYKWDEAEDEHLAPNEWKWTIAGSFPIEVEAFIQDQITEATRLGRIEGIKEAMEILRQEANRSDRVMRECVADGQRGTANIYVGWIVVCDWINSRLSALLNKPEEKI